MKNIKVNDLNTPIGLLKELKYLFDEGTICCDCRVDYKKRPEECGECGILELYNNTNKFLSK